MVGFVVGAGAGSFVGEGATGGVLVAVGLGVLVTDGLGVDDAEGLVVGVVVGFGLVSPDVQPANNVTPMTVTRTRAKAFFFTLWSSFSYLEYRKSEEP